MRQFGQETSRSPMLPNVNHPAKDAGQSLPQVKIIAVRGMVNSWKRYVSMQFKFGLLSEKTHDFYENPAKIAVIGWICLVKF